jgi:uncharacterized protein YbaP (TraB family)
MRRFLWAGLAAVLLSLGAQAKDAHPAIWTVHGAHGTVYLVSSLHLLPREIDWHSTEIETAMTSADSFVFEVPTGASERDEETRFIYHRGLLPAGETLSAKLDDTGRRDYARALSMAGIDAVNLDQKQPWLAEVVLTVQAMYRHNYSADHTPEGDAHAFAAHRGADIRYLDTTRQQMEFLAGANPDGSIGQFSAVLADFPNQPVREAQFVEAWASGDTTASAALVAAGLRDLPDEQRRLLERNHDWAEQIGGMLDERHTFFVAVGIAHLVGPQGVPALLRARGFVVDGP